MVTTKKSIGKSEDQFNDVNAKIDKATLEITEVISDFSNQVANQFKITNKQISALRKDVNYILNKLDILFKKQEIDDDERLVVGHHLDRLDKWVHEMANEIGYKLKV